MKLMDDVAGIVATRHCKTNVVTASVDAINFHDKIKKGTRTLRRMGGGGGLRPLHLWLLARTRRCPGPGICPFAAGSRSLAPCRTGPPPRLGPADVTPRSDKMCNSAVIRAFILLETGVNSSS